MTSRWWRSISVYITDTTATDVLFVLMINPQPFWCVNVWNSITHFFFGSKHHTVSYVLTPRSSLFRKASLDASQLSAWSACSLNNCSWCACISFCRRFSHAMPNVRLNSSRCARLYAGSSWPPPTGRRIPKFFRYLNASCRPSISAWSKCDYKASQQAGTQTHI